MTTLAASRSVTKRLMDLFGGGGLAILLTPLMIVLALGSAISYRSWPLFAQQRLGRNGRRFWFVKIRSLPTSAPVSANKYTISHHPNNRWGRFIRHHHLDELPQLWHVVAGRMSLVGPRPEMPDLAASFDDNFVRERATVRPGCTGLWQISACSVGLIGEAPEYDLHYVRNWTLRLDLWILLRTAIEVVGGRRGESLTEVPDWTGAAPERRPIEVAA